MKRSTYDSPGYSDIDRQAASALRTPILTLLQAVPEADRAAWIAGLAEGLLDGAASGTRSPAYAVGFRMSLLLTEEGYA